MALQTLGSPLLWPGLTRGLDSANAPAAAALSTLNGAGQFIGFVHRATEAMTVSHVEVWVGTVTGSGTLDVRIETVDATTGHPTGTLWGTNTNIAGSTLTSSTTHTLALTASATIAKGDVFAVKFAYNSGTSVAMQTTTGLRRIGSSGAYPYYVANGSSKSAITSCLPWALGSSTTAWYHIPGLTAFTTPTSRSVVSSSHDWSGVRFQVPFKCRAAGIALRGTTGEGDFTYKMLDDSHNELATSGTIDKDQIGGAGIIPGHFTTPVTLSPATFYRAVIVPTATAKAVQIFVAPSANHLTGTSSGLALFYDTVRGVGGGAVTNSTAAYPLMDIIIDQLDDGVSTGGGGFSVSMSG